MIDHFKWLLLFIFGPDLSLLRVFTLNYISLHPDPLNRFFWFLLLKDDPLGGYELQENASGCSLEVWWGNTRTIKCEKAFDKTALETFSATFSHQNSLWLLSVRSLQLFTLQEKPRKGEARAAKCSAAEKSKYHCDRNVCHIFKGSASRPKSAVGSLRDPGI